MCEFQTQSSLKDYGNGCATCTGHPRAQWFNSRTGPEALQLCGMEGS